MNATTASLRRIAAITGATTITCITAITTTYAIQPASAITEPTPDRPCFLIRPHWNTGLDGPQPTCPTPIWQQARSSAGLTDTNTRHRLHFGDEFAADRGY